MEGGRAQAQSGHASRLALETPRRPRPREDDIVGFVRPDGSMGYYTVVGRLFEWFDLQENLDKRAQKFLRADIFVRAYEDSEEPHPELGLT